MDKCQWRDWKLSGCFRTHSPSTNVWLPLGVSKFINEILLKFAMGSGILGIFRGIASLTVPGGQNSRPLSIKFPSFFLFFLKPSSFLSSFWWLSRWATHPPWKTPATPLGIYMVLWRKKYISVVQISVAIWVTFPIQPWLPCVFPLETRHFFDLVSRWIFLLLFWLPPGISVHGTPWMHCKKKDEKYKWKMFLHVWVNQKPHKVMCMISNFLVYASPSFITWNVNCNFENPKSLMGQVFVTASKVQDSFKMRNCRKHDKVRKCKCRTKLCAFFIKLIFFKVCPQFFSLPLKNSFHEVWANCSIRQCCQFEKFEFNSSQLTKLKKSFTIMLLPRNL